MIRHSEADSFSRWPARDLDHHGDHGTLLVPASLVFVCVGLREYRGTDLLRDLRLSDHNFVAART